MNDWTRLPAVEAAVVVVVWGAAWALGRRCLRRVAARPDERAAILLRFTRVDSDLPFLALAAPYLVLCLPPRWLPPRVLDWFFAAGWTAVVVAWCGVVRIVGSVRRAARPEAPRVSMFGAALFVGGWFYLPPLVAGWLLFALHFDRALPELPPDFDVDPARALCFAFATFVVNAFVAGVVRSKASPVEAPPAALVEAFARAAGEGALPEIDVAPMRRAGLLGALAYRRRRRERITIDADLARTYAEGETVALVLHELGHHRLDHLRRRDRTWKISLIALLVVPTFLCVGVLPVFAFGSWLVRRFVLLPQWRRQELEADRFAAQRCGAPMVAAALIRLHRDQDVPEDFGAARAQMTHPDLVRRLEALGVTETD